MAGAKSDTNFILVDGTSSAGKTMISNFFSKINYKCIIGDNYHQIVRGEVIKELPNDYPDDNVESKSAKKSSNIKTVIVKLKTKKLKK